MRHPSRRAVLAFAVAAASLLSSAPARAAAFKKVILMVFENASYDEAMAAPALAQFAQSGALLTNYHAVGHPSQPNYVALVAGSRSGVTSDRPVNLNVQHLGDLLEQHGKTWRVYAQAYPGNCYLGAQTGNYVRKHVPFLSMQDVQSDPTRCANVVDDSTFASDLAGGTLPNFSLFIPDLLNDGHNTSVSYAANWFSSYFGPLLKDPSFTKDTVLILVFDEDDRSEGNQVYAVVYGASVSPGATSGAAYNHYSVLRTIEDQFGLGTLGQNDDSAAPINDIWQ
ncbi:MAG: hypothetical protein HKL90_03845 [Elusimicrobia bacterium]|nr:hypothetical protein [Elusimicrobiota bacterium]